MPSSSLSVVRRRALWLAALLVIAGCGFEPTGEEPMAAVPAVYQQWWAKTEACAGKYGDFRRVRWYSIPGYGFDCPDGRCAGRWQTDDRIFIAEDFRDYEMVVRHEMLHAILDRTGHPEREFKQLCHLTWDTWDGAPPPAAPAGG